MPPTQPYREVAPPDSRQYDHERKVVRREQRQQYLLLLHDSSALLGL